MQSECQCLLVKYPAIIIFLLPCENNIQTNLYFYGLMVSTNCLLPLHGRYSTLLYPPSYPLLATWFYGSQRLKPDSFMARLLKRMALSLSRGSVVKREREIPVSWSRSHTSAIFALYADKCLCRGFWYQPQQRFECPSSKSMGVKEWVHWPARGWLRAHGWWPCLGSSSCGSPSHTHLCPDHGRGNSPVNTWWWSRSCSLKLSIESAPSVLPITL